MKPKISFYTLGCRLNQSETAVIQNTFEKENYSIVDFKDPADIVVINTCTVTENGDADTRRLVNKANRINPECRIALIGCQAQTQKEKLSSLTNVRWIVGNQRKMELEEIVRDWQEDLSAQVIAPVVERDAFEIPLAAIDHSHKRANIKIQDGCDFFCSFCEIPYARGRARSRVFQNIIEECEELAQAGHQEIVITGINVGTYDNAGKTILDVVDALENIQGLKRIRISSIEPTTIPDQLIEKMADKNSKLCRYLHIPLQAGHDQTLQDMKRKYTVEEFENFIQFADKNVPEICIGTDVIVGFPGESDKHFEETYNRLLEWPIHYFHVFSYSERYLAKSRKREDPVEPKIIKERSRRLRELSARKKHIYHQNFESSKQQVLFEQNKEGLWSGLTDNYLRVYVESELDLSNQFQNVQIKSVDAQGLKGELIV